MIVDGIVTADKNPKYGANPGNDTTDKIFLLSITEAEKYFSSNSKRVCKPTAYAEANGVYISNDSSCWWWLRSPGVLPNSAADVADGGSIYYVGNYANDVNICVRPAMWISIE